MRFLNVWRHAYAARGGAVRLDYLRLWAAWADAMGRLFVGACGVGAVARPRGQLIGAGAGAANCAAVGSAAFTRCARGGAPARRRR